ncbi:leucine-rich repeat-containing protein 74A-like isoform X2 [Ostrea edulis]|uniref:leucine-rich repeat-containing protein 74A-like isoform X2 n=1 Tax=Ostrea edulis TaxID=37623 RepID=UPI0024AFA24C|nr:leucine-rich repeat-containing protein 74A-like isoform X2 [Ostrea edulis]
MASVKAEYIGTTTARFTPDKKAISKVFSKGSSRGTPVKTRVGIEDDQETVLDISVPHVPYDDTGRRTYEKICQKLGVVPSSKILKKLAESPNIDVKHYGLGPKGTMAVSVALVINSTVTTLNISGNNIDKTGILYIQRMMEENLTITDLDVSDNHLKTFGAKAIGMMLHDNKGIKRLNIAGNEFTDLDAPFLTKEIEIHPALEYLDISHNEFGDLAGPSFEKMISENNNMTELNISWNQFRIPGAKCLARGLRDNMKLKLVNASWNGLDDEGAMAFSDCLANNAVLTELDISRSRIGNMGYAQVMRALKKNEDLEVLRIGKNNITEETVKVSIDLLKEMPSLALVVLDLSDVMLGTTVAKELESLKDTHPDLEVIHGYTDSYGKRKMAGFMDMGEEALWIIKEFIEEKDLTVAKLFAEFDEDGSNSVDYDEFRQGIKLAKIPLSSYQVDALIGFIDIDGDGDIDFSELVLTMKEITKKRKEEDEQRQAESQKRR